MTCTHVNEWDRGRYICVDCARITWVPNNHGYPYQARCECGWLSRTYAAAHAAKSMLDDHLKTDHV